MQQCIMTTSCLHVAKGMCNMHRYSKTKLQYPRMILERYSNGVYKEPYFLISSNIGDAFPSPGVNPLEGSPKCSCGKLGLGRRSRLLAL
jgi:hypothetical protein